MDCLEGTTLLDQYSDHLEVAKSSVYSLEALDRARHAYVELLKHREKCLICGETWKLA